MGRYRLNNKPREMNIDLEKKSDEGIEANNLQSRGESEM